MNADQTPETPATHSSIIVHSHLRWDFVWQRPQQLLSRIADAQRVLFVEEPLFEVSTRRARLEVSTPLPGVWRVVPVVPSGLRDQYDITAWHTRELLRQLTTTGALAGQFDQPVHWFYTPMAAPAMLGAFEESCVVYDCMDELSQFRFAPSELVDREKLLLSEADVVFTGGMKLYDAKTKLHGNVHFFGCGVDVAHFAPRALDWPSDLRFPQDGIVGYYGVIDERLDYELIATLAEQLPDVAIVMIGPVVKVDANDLPKAPNLYWLGARDYAQLPAYAAAFDVCLMPFALNAATEYINPTKTLEYMAAERPVVSTAIRDVIDQFDDVVHVAHDHAQFVEMVRTLLDDPDEARLDLGAATAADHSWESIVDQMHSIIGAAILNRAALRSARRDASDRRRRDVRATGDER